MHSGADIHGAPAATTPLADRYLRHTSGSGRRTLGALLMSGRIGQSEMLAADRWLRDYAQAVHGARVGNGGSGARSPGGPGDGILHALSGYRMASGAVGRCGTSILVSIIADERSMSDLARAASVDRQFVAGMVVVVLKRLAEHYGDLDSVGRSSKVH